MQPIRHPEPSERAAVAALWQQCFPEDSAAYVSWYFDEVYEARNTLALFDGAHLASSLQLNPYPLRLRGKRVPAAAMAGVDTDPAYRRQGLAGELIRAAFVLMRHRGQAMSFLYPFRESFYEVYGYTCSYLRQVGTIPAQALRGEMPGIAREIPMDCPGELLLPAYRQAFLHREGAVDRDAAMMARRLADCAVDGSRCVALEGAGGIVAYAIFCEEADRIVVQEQAVEEQQAAALLAAVARACPKATQVQVTSAGRWDLPGMVWETQHGDMLRVVDVQAALQGMQASFQGKTCLAVRDDCCPWNDHPFELIAGEQGLEVLRTERPAQAELDVRTLARLLTGYQTVGKAVEVGDLQGQPQALEALACLFPAAVPDIIETY